MDTIHNAPRRFNPSSLRALIANPGIRAEVAGEAAALYIYDLIGQDPWTGEGVGAKAVAAELDRMKGVKTLSIYINSPGGDAFEGSAIYSLLKRFEGQKVVHVDGLAASAASLIAMAGDLIVTGKAAMWMIHNAWTFAGGDENAMRDTAERLSKVDEMLAGVYSARTGMDVAKVRGLMSAETWMTADDALAMKFSDETVDERDPLEEATANNPAAAAMLGTFRAMAIARPIPNPAALSDRVSPRDAATTEAAMTEAEKAAQAKAEADAKIKAQADALEAMKAQLAAVEAKLSTPVTNLGEQLRATPGLEVRDNLPEGHGGFKSFGEFAKTVRASSRGNIDQRLIRNEAIPGNFGSEGVNQDGGFAVPPDFRAKIVEQILGEDSLIGRTDQQVTASNAITVPTDATSPWSTAGVQAAWENEAVQSTTSKIAVGQLTVRANKIKALVPMTDELLEDVPAMASYLASKVPGKFDFALNEAILNGTGIGRPLGILNAPCLVTQAAEAGQAVDTVVTANIEKMWSRMYAPSRRNAVWLMNQDVEPQLAGLMLGTTPLYMPAGGISGSPYATLKGRPIIFTEACGILGDVGDVVLADLSQYLTVRKSSGMKMDVSMHLWFEYDTTAFRFQMRVGGQPWWAAPLARKAAGNTNTLSPFVTLAAR